MIIEDKELALRLLGRYGSGLVTLDPKDCIVDMLDQIDEMKKQKEQLVNSSNTYNKILEKQIEVRDKELKDLKKKNCRQADEITILLDQKKRSRDIRCKDFKALEKLNDENKELKAQHIELKVQMCDRLNGKIEEIQALTDIISDRDAEIELLGPAFSLGGIRVDTLNLDKVQELAEDHKELIQDHMDLTETCGDLMEEKENLSKQLTMAYASLRAGALEREGLEEDKAGLTDHNSHLAQRLENAHKNNDYERRWLGRLMELQVERESLKPFQSTVLKVSAEEYNKHFKGDRP